jgi:hypothetical protein
MNKIKIHSFHKYKNNHFIYIKTWFTNLYKNNLI